MKTLYILLISTCVLVGCNNSDDIALTDDDYLIFGHYYGECGGEGCIETFKLTSNTLYEDTLDNYSGSGPFNFVMLDANTFDQVDSPDDVEFYYTEFGDSSINYLCRFWIDAESMLEKMRAKTKAIIEIKKAYDQAGINIPFPIRTLEFNNKLNIKSDELETAFSNN